MAIDSILANASARISGAVRDAARATGASFEYLLTAARTESNLNPAAQATTSSATGLYQFVDQTWLATLKNAGPAHGYGQYADAITVGPDGRYGVPDPTMRAAIMRLRNDPTASATMAAAFTQGNAAQFSAAFGPCRPISGRYSCRCSPTAAHELFRKRSAICGRWPATTQWPGDAIAHAQSVQRSAAKAAQAWKDLKSRASCLPRG